MPVESVPAHFSVRQHVEASAELEIHGLVNRAVLDALELRVAQFSGRKLLASFFQIGRAQQATDNVAPIHGSLPLLLHSNKHEFNSPNRR